MDIGYIIVQAGGKGTRMEHLTRNKPKALIPVENLPMLFHLFNKYPRSKFLVIGDYKYDVLEKYLSAFSPVKYKLISAQGYQGTCAGLKEAISKIPAHTNFMLIWSDLILPAEFQLPEACGNYIGVAKDFSCRWKYENECFKEEQSVCFGVAGMFLFQDSTMFLDVPKEGEFVRWLSHCRFDASELPLYKTKEYGVIAEYNKLEAAKCRPFNRITIQDDIVMKEGIDEQGLQLAVRECAWYRKIINKNFTAIPSIYSLSPLKMEKIDGKNIYSYNDLSFEKKYEILRQIISCLKSLHNLEQVLSDKDSYHIAYIAKTLARLQKVQKLVPFAENRTVTINGRECRNVFFHVQLLEEKCIKYFPHVFKLIHGDCTFSNILLRKDGSPVLIDPRGYFGTTEIYGDAAYDWAKLYYSVVGNYDQFNLKHFDLTIGNDFVTLSIQSNGWEDMENEFFQMLSDEVTPEQIKLLHAIIWLSLTTYAWEDYDSICGAFYNGLYYLEEIL